MVQLFANNAATTLASPAVATDTALTLTDGSSFPSPTGGDFFLLTLATGNPETAWEIVKVTARSGNVATVARAQEGTTAQAWAAGAKAELRLTAGSLQTLAAGANTLLHGTVDPTPAVGVDGDFYINEASHYLFGPKAAGVWPAGVSLVGPAGGGGGAISQYLVDQRSLTITTTSTSTANAPTITQGIQISSITITPTAIGKTILVKAHMRAALNNSYSATQLAIFKDGASPNIAYSNENQITATWPKGLDCLFKMVTTSLSPIVFTMRGSSVTAGTLTIYPDSWLEVLEIN